MDTSNSVLAPDEVECCEPWVLPVIGRSREVRPEPVGIVEEQEIESTDTEQKGTTETAEAVLPTAQEIEDIRKSAESDGYETGYLRGLEDGRQRVEASTTQLLSIIDQLAEPLAAVDSAVEDELAGLAIDISKQIVRRELKTARGEVVAIVQQAISILPLSDQELTVYVNPADAQVIRECMDIDETSARWTLQEDPGIGRGGCRIARGYSCVDGTVEKRLAGIVASVLGEERRDSRSA